MHFGRSFLALSLSLPILACSALLGDFSVTGDGTDSGGTEDTGATEDGEVVGDGGGTTDAPIVAPPVYKCAINGSPVKLATGNVADGIAVHAFRNKLAQQKRRVAWALEGSNNINFTTIDENLTASSILNQSADTLSFPWIASYDGGFLALSISNKSGVQLTATRFIDDDVNPQPLLPITEVGLMTTANDVQTAAASLGGDDFFVVLSYQSSPGTWSLYAGRPRIAPGAAPSPFKKLLDLTARPSFESETLLVNKGANRASLFIRADKGVGDTTLVEIDMPNLTAVAKPKALPGPHPGYTLDPIVASTDVNPGVDKAGLAFLEYNLNSPDAGFFAYSRAVPANQLGAISAAVLPPPVGFATPGDVAVDKGRGTWRHFPAGSHLVMAARKTLTGQGVNFLWMDGDGFLRGKASGVNALVQGDSVKVAAGVIAEAPNATFANAIVTWAIDAGELRIANVSCSP